MKRFLSIIKDARNYALPSFWGGARQRLQNLLSVIPVQTGIQALLSVMPGHDLASRAWIPAFARMTERLGMTAVTKLTLRARREVLSLLRRGSRRLARTVGKLPKPVRRLAYAALTVLILVSPFLLYVVFKPQQTEAAWADDNWGYRQLVPVTNNASQQTNVYISVTLNSSDTAKFQSDCGDIRFTKQNGEQLPYYLVSGCGGASTVTHVQFDVFPAGSQAIYYYYGNPSAANGTAAADFTTLAGSYTVGTIAGVEVGVGPVAWWKFDDGTGTTAQDSTSNNNDGTLTGVGSSLPTWQTEDMCVSGKCLKFDGGNDYVRKSSFTTPGNSFTMVAWFKANSVAGDTTIVTMGDHSVADQVIFLSSSKIKLTSYYTTGNADGFSGNTTVQANAWYQVAFVRDASGPTLYIYLNGILDKSAAATNATANYGTSPTLDAGSRGTDGKYFNGFIDDVKIYPYARSAAQVKADYAARGASKGVSLSQGDSLSKTNALSNGLVGYWKMDEPSWNGTAGEVLDASGNGNSGVGLSGATTGAGKFGNGGSFDGMDDYVDAGTSDSLRMTNTEVTLAAWIKTTNNDNQGYISQRLATASPWDGYAMAVGGNTTNGKLGFWYGNGVSWDFSNSTVNDNSWHHVVTVFNSVQTKFYIDGRLDATVDKTGTVDIDSSGKSLIIGYDSTSNDRRFSGQIDELRIYNRALSPKEVRDLYNFAPGPLRYLKMEEGKGTSANDSSGNGGTGTVNNGTWTTGKYGKGVKLNGTGGSDVSVPDFGY